jgi:hypothetical protein
MQKLNYDNFEKIILKKPTGRIEYFRQNCQGKIVMDLGSYDETAVTLKKNTNFWLFSVLESNAKKLVGVDSALPENSIVFKSAIILKKDVHEINKDIIENLDTITAGELLEHLPNPSLFLKFIKEEFSGKELILSTPNGLNFSNTLMGILGKEVQHEDHLHLFTYKTLNTLFINAKFLEWEIIPYYFFATEMKLRTKSRILKVGITAIEKTINGFEYLFPLLSMGYVAKIKI